MSEKDPITQSVDALEFLLKRFTPQINGADETCWTVGLRQQLSELQYSWVQAVLADARTALATERFVKAARGEQPL
jgi:hypothetical protein